MTHLLTYSVSDNLKARDASASKKAGERRSNVCQGKHMFNNKEYDDDNMMTMPIRTMTTSQGVHKGSSSNL